METLSPPRPAVDLSTQLYYQLVYTLTDLLPPPFDDTPDALRTRNHAAIAKVAALPPGNANEADLAAQCIAACAQAAAAPVGAPAACVDLRIEENVSKNGTNSHDVAFETGLSEQPQNRGPEDRVRRVCTRFCAQRWAERL